MRTGLRGLMMFALGLLNLAVLPNGDDQYQHKGKHEKIGNDAAACVVQVCLRDGVLGLFPWQVASLPSA